MKTWRSGRWLEPVRRGAVFVIAGLAAGGEGISAQEREPVPTIPAGVTAVVLPLQASQPTPGGAWLAGAATERATIDLLNAELAFALGEEDGAVGWALPDDVEGRLARNPMIRIDPRRLAYHGLVREPEAHTQIYEPLHTQLRQIAALFDARIVILPLVAWYQLPTEDEKAAAVRAGLPPPTRGRAAMLTAVIDIRRSAVLWHGQIEGDTADATSRTALTTLALRAAAQLSPS
jgi:hypothetical protein